MAFTKKKPSKTLTKVVIAKPTAAQRRKVTQQLLSKYGREVVWTFDGKSARPPVEVIATQCYGLNWTTDRGGFPRGRPTMIQGRESSGKTTVCYHLIKVVQRRGGSAAFIDVENSVDLLYMKQCGVKMDESFFLAQPDYAEQAWAILEDLIESGQYDLIVLDSIAGMAPLSELRGKVSDQQMALMARLNAKMARRLNTKLKGTRTALIYVNQLRDKIGGFQAFGPQTMSPGGRALKHAASIIMEMQPTKPLLAGSKRRVGFMTRVRVTKNKIGQPSRQVEIPITFGHGVDERLDFINMLMAAKILKKGPSKSGYFLKGQKLAIAWSWMGAYEYFQKHKRDRTSALKQLKAYLADESVVVAMSSDEEQ